MILNLIIGKMAMNTQKRVPLVAMNRLKPENVAAEISRLNHDLARRAQELAMLNKAGQMMTSSLDLNAVLATALDEVIRLLDVVGASVWLLEPAPGEGPPHTTHWVVCRAVAGEQQEVVRNWRLALGQGIVGWVAQSGQPLIVPDVQADDRHFQEVDQRTGLPLRAILSVPLQVKDSVIGVLQVVDVQVGRFSTDDLTLLEPLAAFTAIAVENARLYAEAKRLRDFNEEIVQSMEEGVLLEDAAGYITFVNTKMAELLGAPADTLFGQHWTGIAAADSLMLLHEWGGQSPENSAKHYETELVMTNGQRLPVLVSGRLLWTPSPEDAEAHFAGILAVFTDITERKQGEATLRRRNKDLATLNAITTAIGQPVGLDQAFRVILDKTLEVTNMPAGAIHLLDITKGTLSLAAQHGLPAPLRAEVRTVNLGHGAIGQVAKWSKSIVQERVVADPDAPGSAQFHGYAGLPITSHNRVLGVFSVYSHSLDHLNVHEVQLLTAIANQIGVVVENTRRAEEVAQMEILRELNRLRSELIANASHELRTPLGLIKVFCTSLLAEDVKFDVATRQQFLRGIDEETDKLKLIVDNLLGLSTLESGRLRLERQPTDLAALVQKVTEAMQLELERSVTPARHHFVLDFPTTPLVAPIDAKRIEQVLRNLLNNALKYSPNGGAVTIQGRGDKWQALVRISDEGIGMQPEDLERIFDRFYRVEDDTTRAIGGVGLGLAVCKGIVEAHGGRIWAESAPGAGSHFYFTLPMAETDEL